MKERKTQKPLEGQITFGLPAEERKGNFGLVIDSEGYLQTEGKPDLQMAFLNQPNVGKRERMAHTPAAEFWKNRYKDSIMKLGLDEETGWRIYAEFHFSTVDAIDKMLKRMEKGEIYGEELEYSNVEFFRAMLLSPKIRQEKAYFLGLVCLRIPQNLEEFDEFDEVGIALIQKAEQMAPKNPKYKLALWRENARMLEVRRGMRKDAKEAEDKLPRSPKPKLVNRYNAPEAFQETSFGYYQEIIDHSTQILVEMSQEKKIDFGKVKETHEDRVKSARKMLMNDSAPGTKRQRYDIGFFDHLEIEKLPDFNVYFLALIALYAPYAKDRVQLEVKAWDLLKKLFQRSHDPKIAWVAGYEASRLLVEHHIQTKRKAKTNEFTDMVRENQATKRIISNMQLPINTGNDDPLPF